MTDEEFIRYQMRAIDLAVNAPVPEWHQGMNPWTFKWETTRIIRPRLKTKRYPSSKGYGSRP